MGSDWRKNFSKITLDRGYEYYSEGRITNLKDSGDRIIAVANGNDSYLVKAFKDPDKAHMNSCTCPHFYSGNQCKHIAALMILMETKNLLEKKTETQVQEPAGENVAIFTKNPEAPYRFFDMNEITSSCFFTKEVAEESKKFFDEKRINIEEFKTASDTATVIATFTGNDRAKSEIFLSFSRRGLTDCLCRVPGCRWFYSDMYGKKQKPCSHVTGVLRACEEKISRENPGDCTDSKALSVMKYFLQSENKKKRLGEEKENPERCTVTLEPRMKIYSNYLLLEIRSGSGKKYLIKNIAEFCDAVRNQIEYKTGKNSAIDFSREEFDSQSEKLFSFIEGIIDERNAMDEIANASYFVRKQTYAKDSLQIFGKKLDELFDIFAGTEVECSDMRPWSKNSFSGEKMEFSEKDIPVEIELAQTTGKSGLLESIVVKGNIPEMLIGSRHRYWTEGNSFYRAGLQNTENIRMLEKISDHLGNFTFTAGRKMAVRFLNHVLPMLETFCVVKKKEIPAAREFSAISAELFFYLDSSCGTITLDAQAVYDGKKHTLAQPTEEKFSDEHRDYLIEEKAEKIISRYFNITDTENGIFIADDEEKIFLLLAEGISELASIGEVNATENFRKLKIRKRTKISVGVSASKDKSLLDIKISSEDFSNDELHEILENLRKKKKYIRLKNGDFLNTEDKALSELEELSDALHLGKKDFAKKKISVPSYRALFINQALNRNSSLTGEKNKSFSSIAKSFENIEEKEIAVPGGLEKILKPYQVYGFKWLETLKDSSFNGILADDMGLGKTLQTIALLSDKNGNTENIPSIVIAPSSLVYNWIAEFRKFAPQTKVLAVTGTKEQRSQIISSGRTADVLVTSYDLLKRDAEEYEGITFWHAVLDEAQTIKNHTTSAAKSVKSIFAVHRLALTGTPIENRLSELWSIFDFLMPGFLFSYEDFRKRFEIPVVKNGDRDRSEQLKKLVSPFILRRIKEEVLDDLPEKTEEIRYAEFDEAQEKVYQAQALRIREFISGQKDADFRKQKIRILAELMRIRQICCDPSLLFENYSGDSAKRKICMELVKKAVDNGHKVLLFSQFTSMLTLLEKDFEEEGITYFKITGATPKEKRLELVDEFNSNSTNVFLISLKAGGTGLNLTGADVVIHYDPWWNTAVQDQATDRAYRIGQQRNVSVFKLIAKDTIEERIMELQEAKKNLSDEILSGDKRTIADFSQDELLGLL